VPCGGTVGPAHWTGHAHVTLTSTLTGPARGLRVIPVQSHRTVYKSTIAVARAPRAVDARRRAGVSERGTVPHTIPQTTPSEVTRHFEAAPDVPSISECEAQVRGLRPRRPTRAWASRDGRASTGRATDGPRGGRRAPTDVIKVQSTVGRRASWPGAGGRATDERAGRPQARLCTSGTESRAGRGDHDELRVLGRDGVGDCFDGAANVLNLSIESVERVS